jgi:hypothetical protein
MSARKLDITRSRASPQCLHDRFRGSAAVAATLPQHAQSNSLSAPGESALSTRTGKARQFRVGPATGRLVGWRIHSHRLSPRRPRTPSCSPASPVPTSFIFTLCGPDTQLEGTLGGLLATSRCLVGRRPFCRFGAQVRGFFKSPQNHELTVSKDTFSLL